MLDVRRAKAAMLEPTQDVAAPLEGRSGLFLYLSLPGSLARAHPPLLHTLYLVLAHTELVYRDI